MTDGVGEDEAGGGGDGVINDPRQNLGSKDFTFFNISKLFFPCFIYT